MEGRGVGARPHPPPDGEEGFPGAVQLHARFALTGPETFEIAYRATADAPTALALSHHLYFNLLGDRSATILDHRLTVAADGFTPVGEGLIPTGAIAPVQGTPFDLRDGATLRDVLARQDAQLALAKGVDQNWALSGAAAPALTLVAPDGARLEIQTDQPGMQIYSGQHLKPPFPPHGGLALEPQGFPDAVNHPGFPSAILRPGETYSRFARYTLTA